MQNHGMNGIQIILIFLMLLNRQTQNLDGYSLVHLIFYDNWGLDDVTVTRLPAASSSWTLDFGDGEIRQIGKETEFDWQGFGGSGTGILNINGVEFLLEM